MKKNCMAVLTALGALLCQPDATAATTVVATTADIGKVIGKNGKIYANRDAASSDGTTAYAMIAYVNTEEARGLAIAVRDVGNGYKWDEAMAAAANFAAGNAVEFGRWRLPTVDDFKYMFQGCGGPEYSSESGEYGYGQFRNRITACGATEIGADRYWTGNENNSTTAWQYNFWSGRFDYVSKTTTNWVRCCLEFDIESDTAGRTGDCRWKFNAATGTLVIYGAGAMEDYASSEAAPWLAKHKSAITNVVIESGVTHIGDRAFYNCAAMTGATLPDSVESIGDSAFYACKSLARFTLSASLDYIGDYAFFDCSGMTDVYCHPNPSNLTWGNEAFKSNGETIIHVRSGRLAAYKAKFGAGASGAFAGDLPYDSYAQWEEDCNITADKSGIDATPDDAGRMLVKTDGGNALIVYVDSGRGTGFAIQFNNIDNSYDSAIEPYSEQESWDDAVAYTNIEEFGTWRLPTADELKRIFAACGGDAYSPGVSDGEDCYCGQLLKYLLRCQYYYWTATESGADTAYVYDQSEGRFSSFDKNMAFYRVPVLEFKITKPSWAQDGTVSGIANAFLYAFSDATGDFGGKPLIDISFADGKAVVKTPKVVNTAGFTYSIVASDNASGDGNVAVYPLSADGETIIDEAPSGTRFFRLKAETGYGY